MIKRYLVEIMAEKDFKNYMMGDNDYFIYTADIMAESPRRAYEIAKSLYPNMFVNEHVMPAKSSEEIYVEKEIKEKELKNEQKKKKESKKKKIERDLAKGITPEMRKAMNNARRYELQIEKLEAELKELKEKKAYWEGKAK